MTSFLLFMVVPLLIIYLLIGIVFYFNQEKLFFKPIKLAKNYTFKFNQDFEEIKSATKDGIILNSLLFKIKNSKGVIFYLHGNGNSLEKFGKLAPIYTNLGYDIFMTDYRGYGKSEGALSDEHQLFEDNQFLYNELKKSYKEEDIIIIGYSLGSSLAAKLASENTPKLLVLKAPFYNFKDVPFELWEIKKFERGLIVVEQQTSNSNESIDKISGSNPDSLICEIICFIINVFPFTKSNLVSVGP